MSLSDYAPCRLCVQQAPGPTSHCAAVASDAAYLSGWLERNAGKVTEAEMAHPGPP